MLQKFAPLVKRQLEYWQRQIDQYGPDNPRYRAAKAERYKQLVSDFTELLDYLNRIEGTDLQIEARFSPEIAKPKGGSVPRYRPRTPLPESVEAAPVVAAIPDEFADLPPELLEQLSEGAKAQVDPVIKIINDRGGTATLDQILIDLYRATKEVHKRTMVQNKLFRLSKRELCWSMPGKKGVYTTTEPKDVRELVAPRQTSEPEAKIESPPAATDGPSDKQLGAAGLPGDSSKAPAVGPTPTASTVLHRNRLMSETAAVNLFSPKNRTGK
jgi:hypothetical protein